MKKRKYKNATEWFEANKVYVIAIVVVMVFYKKIKNIVSGVFETLGLKRSEAEKQQKRREQMQKEIDKAEASGVIQEGLISPAQVVNDATEIVNAFGLNYGWWHPYYWTENEEAALTVLRRHTANTISFVSTEYANQTGGRVLQADCVKYLNVEQYNSIKHVFLI